jgi:abortive infection bacteriophage resistance protein
MPPPNLPTFTKPALDLDAQVALLVRRGLTVADPAAAKRHLAAIGYYRFSGYMLPFQQGGAGPNRHDFRPGTSFETVLDLYTFDRRLRLLTLDSLERIEIALRAAISNTLSTAHGPHWFLDPRHFAPGADHARLLAKIEEDIGHAPALAHRRDVAIRHYYARYGAPRLPPSWMIFEALSFGTVSQLYRLLDRRSRKPVARLFGLGDTVLQSWMHAISYTRNLCAHHARLWNRNFTIKPMVASAHQADLVPNTSFYAQAAVMQVLLRAIPTDGDWPAGLAALFARHPAVPIATMGFPADWRRRPLWN